MADIQHKDLTGADIHAPKAHTMASHSDITVTGAQVDDAAGKRHPQTHGMASAADHTPLENGADGRLYVSNAAGLPYINTEMNIDDIVQLLTGVYVTEQTQLAATGYTLDVSAIANTFYGDVHVQSVGNNPGTALFTIEAGVVSTINKNSVFTHTKDTASSINFYFESNIAVLQNNTAGSIDVKLEFVGRI